MKPCIIQIPPPTGYEYLDVLQIACGINHCDAPAADSVCKAPLIYAKKKLMKREPGITKQIERSTNLYGRNLFQRSRQHSPLHHEAGTSAG